MSRLQLRAHHFLCTLGFRGKGYSPAFVENFARIARSLTRAEDGDRVEIEVVAGLDAVCGQCPNHDGSVCISEHKISRLDAGHAEVLGLKPGQVLTWGEAKRRLAGRMDVEKFEAVCAPCAWKSMGVCLEALEEIKSAEKETE